MKEERKAEFIKHSLNKSQKQLEGYWVLRVGPMLVFCIVALIAFCVNFPTQNILNCIQITVAPKVYLVSEAAKIIKQ